MLADSEQLHRKIAEMSKRIEQLEDALAALQNSVSRTPHPLLRDDLLRIKHTSELNGAPISERREDIESPQADAPPSLDAPGILTISDHGNARFYGPSAGSEVCIQRGREFFYLQK